MAKKRTNKLGLPQKFRRLINSSIQMEMLQSYLLDGYSVEEANKLIEESLPRPVNKRKPELPDQ
jgi:hypothetical protein